MNSIIPEGITSIDEQAFTDCSFSSIEIPASVISIKDWAFSGCSLTSIEIPASVTLIGEYAFYACSSLISITVDENNAFYDSRDNSNVVSRI
ncbi:MAG: leucine-rich repeat domain-containing protein [Bacteroidales bacterium]|nr:leucine-rich repeat domain-containing protein [Bacteroidales bacterium]